MADGSAVWPVPWDQNTNSRQVRPSSGSHESSSPTTRSVRSTTDVASSVFSPMIGAATTASRCCRFGATRVPGRWPVSRSAFRSMRGSGPLNPAPRRASAVTKFSSFAAAGWSGSIVGRFAFDQFVPDVKLTDMPRAVVSSTTMAESCTHSSDPQP